MKKKENRSLISKMTFYSENGAPPGKQNKYLFSFWKKYIYIKYDMKPMADTHSYYNKIDTEKKVLKYW